MPLQGCFDDSYDPGVDGPYVLGGHIATVEQWLNFVPQWQALNERFGDIDARGERHFHMTEIMRSPERREFVAAFLRVITANVLSSVSCVFELADFKRAQARVHVPGYEFKAIPPFVFGWSCLLNGINSNRAQISKIIGSEPIDFYFDAQGEERHIHSIWSEFLDRRSEEERIYYGSLSFRDDKDFLPLQAADLWAWWTRSKLIGRGPDKIANLSVDRMSVIDPNNPPTSPMHKEICIRMTEDQIVETLMGWAADTLAAMDRSAPIYDLGSSSEEGR